MISRRENESQSVFLRFFQDIRKELEKNWTDDFHPSSPQSDTLITSRIILKQTELFILVSPLITINLSKVVPKGGINETLVDFDSPSEMVLILVLF